MANKAPASISNLANLPLEYIAECCADLGFDIDSKTVVENAIAANDIHGDKARNFDGNMKTFWGCDCSGTYTAPRLFRGYLESEAYEGWCDGMAARRADRDNRD